MTTNPIHLDSVDVIAKARQAYLEGRLSLQVSGRGMCRYRDFNGAPCVIGAALSDEDAERFDAQDFSSITMLRSEGLVTTDNADLLDRLQQAHDNADFLALRDLLNITDEDILNREKV